MCFAAETRCNIVTIDVGQTGAKERCLSWNAAKDTS